MLDSEERAARSDAAARWQADHDRIAARFAGQPGAGEPGMTHSGIPLTADAEQLRAWGVREVYGPGSQPDDAVELIKGLRAAA